MIYCVRVDRLDDMDETRPQRRHLTRRDREVVDFTRSRVKNYSELTNFGNLLQIEGYNGK